MKLVIKPLYPDYNGTDNNFGVANSDTEVRLAIYTKHVPCAHSITRGAVDIIPQYKSYPVAYYKD